MALRPVPYDGQDGLCSEPRHLRKEGGRLLPQRLLLVAYLAEATVDRCPTFAHAHPGWVAVA